MPGTERVTVLIAAYAATLNRALTAMNAEMKKLRKFTMILL